MSQRLTLYRGDSDTLIVTATDTGEPYDLTDTTLRFTAKRRFEDDDSDAIIVKTLDDGITVTDALGGLAVITISPEDTADLPNDAVLLWDLQATQDETVRTLADGTLKVSRDVSRTAP